MKDDRAHLYYCGYNPVEFDGHKKQADGQRIVALLRRQLDRLIPLEQAKKSGPLTTATTVLARMTQASQTNQ